MKRLPIKTVRAAKDRTMQLTRRHLLGASTALLGARLTGPAFAQLGGLEDQRRIVGSWWIRGQCGQAEAGLNDSAVVQSSGVVEEVHFAAGLVLACNSNGYFQGSLANVNITSRVPRGYDNVFRNLRVVVLADGKEVGRLNAQTPLDLRTAFGDDLAQLTPVKTLEMAIAPTGGSVTPIFKATLDQTAGALDVMRALANVGKEGETWGSWKLNVWDEVATAQVDKSAIVTDGAVAGGDKSLKPGYGELWLSWRPGVEFFNDTFTCAVDLPPGREKDAFVRLVADGKEVARNADSLPFQGPDQKYRGLQLFKFDLQTCFGKDLQGLVPVGNIKAILTVGAADTTVYEANLARTGDLLKRMVEGTRQWEAACNQAYNPPVRPGPPPHFPPKRAKP
jgi:hypothetical protein